MPKLYFNNNLIMPKEFDGFTFESQFGTDDPYNTFEQGFGQQLTPEKIDYNFINATQDIKQQIHFTLLENN